MRVFFQRNPYCFMMAQKIKELKEESAHKIGKKFIEMGDWFGKTYKREKSKCCLLLIYIEQYYPI